MQMGTPPDVNKMRDRRYDVPNRKERMLRSFQIQISSAICSAAAAAAAAACVSSSDINVMTITII